MPTTKGKRINKILKRLFNEIKQIFILLLFGILSSSCSPGVMTQESIDNQATATQVKISTPTVLTLIDQLSTPTATPGARTLTALDGSLMLLQTGVDSFHILDLATYALFPYDLPGINAGINLSSNLSPDGKQLLIFTSDHSFKIVNILSKESTFSYDFSQDAISFDLDRAVEAALQIFQGYTKDFMQDLIEQTIQQSQQDIQWFQNSQKLLIIKGGSGFNSNLSLLDLSTGETKLLEQNPRLVENYWVGPGDDKILIRKGFSSAANDWQDDQYFLVDLVNGNSLEIPLPANTENPSVYWFSDDLLGVIHQSGIVGGTDFSLISIPDMDSKLVVSGSFSSLNTYGTDILTLSQDRVSQKTNLTLQSYNEDLITTQEFTGICSVKRKITGSSLVLNCETESYLVEGQDLRITDFSEPIFLFSRSPDRQYFVLITKDKDARLITSDFQEQIPIQLQSDPLEILWLPDSSGFLYRTARELMLYNLTEGTNNFIIASDFFGDYRNLNAVWITHH